MLETLDHKLRVILPLHVCVHLAITCAKFEEEGDDIIACQRLLTRSLYSYSLLARPMRLLGAAAVFSVYRSKEVTLSEKNSMAKLLLSSSGCDGQDQALEKCAEKLEKLSARNMSLKRRNML